MKIDTKRIKAFLHDAKAVSPAIATLILIVVAAVAAAGIGILVTQSQGSSKQLLGTKTQSVQGQINIQGSTTVLPVSLLAGPAFMSANTGYTVSAVGGGSGVGRCLAWTTTSPITDIGASSEQWPDGVTKAVDTCNGQQTLPRNKAVIQLGDANAKVWETKIGTSMVVLAYNKGAVAADPLDISASPSVLNVLNYGALQTTYKTGAILPSGPAAPFTAPAGVNNIIYYRSDSSGTMDTFAAWLNIPTTAAAGVGSYVNHVFTPPTGAGVAATLSFKGLPSNEDIRDAIANCPAATTCIGPVDVGFTSSGVAGSPNVIASTQDALAAGGSPVAATSANKGVGKAYDLASLTTNGIPGSTNGLARDLFYYTQGTPSGAIKAFLDYMLTSDGQSAVQKAGYFSP
jgi:ABC-type phosphate transport system substrate-binding protein